VYREEAINNPPNHCSASLFFRNPPTIPKNKKNKEKILKERIKTIKRNGKSIKSVRQAKHPEIVLFE
jgi:hypothetical protein